MPIARDDQNPAIGNWKSIPDRGHLLTEHRNPASADLDALSVADTLRVINDEDAKIAGVVRAAIPAIAALVETIVERMRRGGRLIYLGAGTSGRLGVLDASECPPTFHVEPGLVIGLIAGGDTALRKSSEGAEDDPDGASAELDRLKVSDRDTVVGIAAGGTTPYVLGALRIAKERGAATALITCAPLSKTRNAKRETPAEPRRMEAAGLSPTPDTRHPTPDFLMPLPVGPEVLTGSTRMKGGTATKLVLNMISTAVMVQLGKAWGNLMVDLRATNAKLRDRAARILTSQCDLSRAQALALLDQADGRVKVALVMAKRGLSAEEARRLLDQHGGNLRPILGPPR